MPKTVKYRVGALAGRYVITRHNYGMDSVQIETVGEFATQEDANRAQVALELAEPDDPNPMFLQV